MDIKRAIQALARQQVEPGTHIYGVPLEDLLKADAKVVARWALAKLGEHKMGKHRPPNRSVD